MNAHAVEVERGYERPIMGAFHAYFSLGGLAAALVGGPLIAAEVDVLITLVAAYAAGILATLACARWVLSARPQRCERSRTAPRPPPPLGWSKHVVGLGLLAFADARRGSCRRLEHRAPERLAGHAQGHGCVGVRAVLRRDDPRRLATDPVVARIGGLTAWVTLPTTFWLPVIGCLAAAWAAPRLPARAPLRAGSPLR